jgi:hypothetical protein
MSLLHPMRQIAAERSANIHETVIAFVVCSWYNEGVRRNALGPMAASESLGDRLSLGLVNTE